MNGRMGPTERRRGGSAEGYGSDPDGYSGDEYDDLDDFIDDDDDMDWRSQLRATTGVSTVQAGGHMLRRVAAGKTAVYWRSMYHCNHVSLGTGVCLTLSVYVCACVVVNAITHSAAGLLASGYDPRKYQEGFWDDRKMEASAAEIAAEERRSSRLGKAEDEKEAEAEARRAAAKEAKRSKKRGAAALFDD